MLHNDVFSDCGNFFKNNSLGWWVAHCLVFIAILLHLLGEFKMQYTSMWQSSLFFSGSDDGGRWWWLWRGDGYGDGGGDIVVTWLATLMCVVMVALFIFIDDVGNSVHCFCSSAMLLLSYICCGLWLLCQAVDLLIQCCCMMLCNSISSYCGNFSKTISLSNELLILKLLLHWCFICL